MSPDSVGRRCVCGHVLTSHEIMEQAISSAAMRHMASSPPFEMANIITSDPRVRRLAKG